MQQQQKQKYLVPHFHDLALVVLSYGMFEITARQLVIIMLAGLIGINIYPHVGGLPVMLRFVVAVLPSLFILPFGWITISGRALESWLLILLRYWIEPRLYTWQQLPQQPRRSMPAAPAQTQKSRKKKG